MTDIVDRLKMLAKKITPKNAEFNSEETYYYEAATEIEALRARIAELEAKDK